MSVLPSGTWLLSHMSGTSCKGAEVSSAARMMLSASVAHQLLSCKLESNAAVCSCQELESMCQTRDDDSTFRGTWQGQHVLVRQLQPADAASQSEAAVRHWLNCVHQLQHPGVLPIIGGCLRPAAVVSPVTKVSLV